MSFTVPCPNCQAAIPVVPANRRSGAQVQCPGCQAMAPLPVAPLVPPAVSIPPLPTTEALPVATLLPDDPPPPSTKAYPAAPVRPLTPPSIPQPPPRSISRRDPDEVAEERAEAARAARQKQILLAGVGLAGLLTVACGGLGAMYLSAYAPADPSVAAAPPAVTPPPAEPPRPPDPKPAPNPWATDKPQPQPEPAKPDPEAEPPARPAWAKEWAPYQSAGGFQVRAPAGGPTTDRSPLAGRGSTRAEQVQAEEAGMRYTAGYADTTDAGKQTAAALLTADAAARGATVVRPPVPVQIDGRPGAESVVRVGGVWQAVRAVRVGDRVFVFRASHTPAELARWPGLDPEAKQREFFNSVRISYTPPAQVTAPTPPPTVAPPSPPTDGGLRLAGRTERFQAVVPVPGRAEFLTFAALPGTPGRTNLIRVSAAGKALGRVTLPAAAEFAVIVAGKLLVAGTADVLVREFDLKLLLADKPPATVTPTRTLDLKGSPTGLAAAASGSLVCATVADGAGGRLVRIDPKTFTASQSVNLPARAGAVAVSADGVAAAVAAASKPGQPGAVYWVDGAKWTLAKTVPLPGPAADIGFLKREAVVLVTGPRPHLFRVTADDEPADLTPVGGLHNTLARHLALTADGRAVLTAGLGTGVEVFDLTATPAKSLGYVGVLPGALMSGPVGVLPNGEAAAAGSGAVIDLRGTAQAK
ncbi:MAG: hypothetical protein U0871_06545 [Gemmataceae bacterium]